MATETEKKKGGVIETTKSGLDGCSAVGGCATSNGCFTSVLVVVLLLASYCIICGIITTADIARWFQEQTSATTSSDSSTTIDDDDVPARRIRVSPVNIRSGPGKKNKCLATLKAGNWVYPTGKTQKVGKDVWVEVQFEDPKTGTLPLGWVMEKFLTTDENYP